jgi:hypothetical protein
MNRACEKFHKENLPCFRASVLVGAVYKTALIFAISAVAFAPAFSGCEKRIGAANIDTVKRMQLEKAGRGLTPKEVESVLGQPTRVEKFTLTRPAVKEFAGERLVYMQDGKEVVLHFVDGKMTDDIAQFGEQKPANADEAKAPKTGAKLLEKKP